MTLRCRCGDPIERMDHPDDPGWIHSPGSDTPCLTAEPAGRLPGGLRRIAHKLKLDSPADVFWNVAAMAVGGGAGWLFSAPWIR